MKIRSFCFNAFQENTYVLVTDSGSCIIVDPGMMNQEEDKELFAFIEEEGLSPKRLILTHCHIDHVLGNRAVYEKYGLLPEFHKADTPVFESNEKVAKMYALPYRPSPNPEIYLNPEKNIVLDDLELEMRFVPGHAPGHVVLVHHGTKQVIAGDTLFKGSIGRTDLPGGDHRQLLSAIRTELFSLEDDYTIWPGHGPETNIGWEKKNNPFLNDSYQG